MFFGQLQLFLLTYLISDVHIGRVEYFNVLFALHFVGGDLPFGMFSSSSIRESGPRLNDIEVDLDTRCGLGNY